MGDHLAAKLTGADDLLAKIFALKREKYGIFKRAGRKVAQMLVGAVRQNITAAIKNNKTTGDLSAVAKLDAAQKRYKKEVSKQQTRKEKRKESLAWAKKLLRKKEFSIQEKVAHKRAKVVLVKTSKKSKGMKAAKVPKAKEFTINQIVKMISTKKEAKLVKQLIENRDLYGPGRLKKQGLVQEIGKTGGLAKSISFKILMAKPTAYAFSRITGELIGGTGTKPKGYQGDWGSRKFGEKPIWKRVSANRVMLLVGATKQPRIVWNPFVKRLVKVNPKRYLHLVESGHSKVIRGRTRGQVAGRYPMARAWATKKAMVLAMTKQAIEQELAAVMAKKVGGGP